MWEGHHFFGCTPSFLCHFLSLFCLLSPFRLLQFYEEKNIFAPENRGGGGGGGGGGVCVWGWGGGRSTALYLTQCRAIQWKIYFNAAERFFSMRQVQPYEQLRQHIIIYDQMLNYWRFPGISSLGFLLRDLFPERKYKGNDVLSVKRNIEK